MLSKRSKELLLAAAEEIENGREPFHIDFLREHNISSSEIGGLCSQMAAAIYGMVTAPDYALKAIMASWAAKDIPGADAAVYRDGAGAPAQ